MIGHNFGLVKILGEECGLEEELLHPEVSVEDKETTKLPFAWFISATLALWVTPSLCLLRLTGLAK